MLSALLAFAAACASAPPVAEVAALVAPAPTAEQNEVVVRYLAEGIRHHYQDEAVGKRLHDLLLKNIEAGRYKAMSREEYTNALTEDLRQASGDLHLRVRHDPTAPQGAPPPLPIPNKLVGPVPVEKNEIRQVSPEVLDLNKDDNFGIVGVNILPGNVGLLKVRVFPLFTHELIERYEAAFTLLRDTNALVIDVSGHDGGDDMTAAHLASYLFQRKPFVFNRILRRNRSTVETWTHEIPNRYSYGETRPVFVVTDRNTFSAGESFVYGVKQLKRATFVGEKTRGGANPGRAVPIGYGYTVMLPTGRAQNPITKANWEGVGISPDIAAAPAVAVKTAHRLALEAVARTSTNPREREQAVTTLQLLSKGALKVE